MASFRQIYFLKITCESVFKVINCVKLELVK